MEYRVEAIIEGVKQEYTVNKKAYLELKKMNGVFPMKVVDETGIKSHNIINVPFVLKES